MDENKSVSEKKEETQVEEKAKMISIFTLSSPQSPLAQALQRISKESFGYEIDKKLYRLLKEIRKACEEYTELSAQIIKAHGIQKGNQLFLKGQGLQDLNALNADLGAQEVTLKTAPIRVDEFPAGISSGDMLLLEDTGILVVNEEK